LQPLEFANHLSRSDAWFLLNDFFLVMTTIIIALESYLDPSLEDRGDVVEPMGTGDYDGDGGEEDEGDIKPDGEQIKKQPIDTRKSPSNQPPEKAKVKLAPIRKFNADEEDNEEFLDNWEMALTVRKVNTMKLIIPISQRKRTSGLEGGSEGVQRVEGQV